MRGTLVSLESKLLKKSLSGVEQPPSGAGGRSRQVAQFAGDAPGQPRQPLGYPPGHRPQQATLLRLRARGLNARAGAPGLGAPEDVLRRRARELRLGRGDGVVEVVQPRDLVKVDEVVGLVRLGLV